MLDHNKKFNHPLIGGQIKLVFNINQDCKYLTTGMINDTTNISWFKYFRDAIHNLKEEGYAFKYIAEMDMIKIAYKRYMTYDSYLKHNISAFEWKLNAIINKDKNIFHKFPQNWRHPIDTKFNCYRVYIVINEGVFSEICDKTINHKSE